MSAAPATFGICPRCARPLRSRGGRPPRYCAVCGQRVGADEFAHALPRPPAGADGRPNVEHRFSHASSVEHRFVRPAVDWLGLLSVSAGVIGLFPICGFPFALLAIPLGALARVSQSNLPSRFGQSGIILGAVGLLLQLSCWSAFR